MKDPSPVIDLNAATMTRLAAFLVGLFPSLRAVARLMEISPANLSRALRNHPKYLGLAARVIEVLTNELAREGRLPTNGKASPMTPYRVHEERTFAVPAVLAPLLSELYRSELPTRREAALAAFGDLGISAEPWGESLVVADLKPALIVVHLGELWIEAMTPVQNLRLVNLTDTLDEDHLRANIAAAQRIVQQTN